MCTVCSRLKVSNDKTRDELRRHVTWAFGDLTKLFEAPLDMENSIRINMLADEFIIQLERDYPEGSEALEAVLCNANDNFMHLRDAVANL